MTPRTVACQAPLSAGFPQASIVEWAAIPFSRKIFLIQGSNPCLLHRRQILYRLSYRAVPGHTEALVLQQLPFPHPGSWVAFCSWEPLFSGLTCWCLPSGDSSFPGGLTSFANLTRVVDFSACAGFYLLLGLERRLPRFYARLETERLGLCVCVCVCVLFSLLLKKLINLFFAILK